MQEYARFFCYNRSIYLPQQVQSTPDTPSFASAQAAKEVQEYLSAAFTSSREKFFVRDSPEIVFLTVHLQPFSIELLMQLENIAPIATNMAPMKKIFFIVVNF